MKKIFFSLLVITSLLFLFSCDKEILDKTYDAKIEIDGYKQDSSMLGNSWFKSKVSLNYTVVNNGNVVINCYRYTIKVITKDLTTYFYTESHYKTVPPNTEIKDSTKFGTSNSKVYNVSIEDVVFE